jgi:hypothetical protein
MSCRNAAMCPVATFSGDDSSFLFQSFVIDVHSDTR